MFFISIGISLLNITGIFKFKFSFLINCFSFLAIGSFSVLARVVISKYFELTFLPVPNALMILMWFLLAYLINSTFTLISS